MDRDSSPVAATFSCDLLDSVSDLFVVFDAAGEFTQWNRAVTEATGHTDEALSSLSTDDLFVDAASVRQRIADADAGEGPFDVTVLTADGDRLDYEFAVTTHGDADGSDDSDDSDDERDGYVVCVGREAAGRSGRGRDWYRTVLEALPDAVYAIETDGTIAYANEAYVTMKGVPRDDLLGTDVDDWIADETVDRADELRRELDAGTRDVGAIEYEFVTGEGARFPAEIRFTRVGDDRFGFSRVGIIRDVTERAERERRLQRQNDRLEEFAAIVSHDLRNPLNVAQGRLELARQEHDSEHLASVERAHDRMWSLIDDLLTLARQGEGTLDLTTVALPALAERCWHSIEQSGARLVVETEATLHADESRLQRLLENLFRNCVEHGPTENRPQAGDSVEHVSPDGRPTDDADANGESGVTVTVGDLPDGFFVADDGPGVPPKSATRCSRPATRRTPMGPASG
ncbi:sensor histidine kinase [Salinigranum rubrum]|uniref:sensor histidine kinase n=1 Tax=Salinigranum rubrum TaxID=755307 RepID=UPI001FEC4314|nr:PAS domain-containing sensor histidine kinase [Salinigranum rubrum]